MFDTDRPGSVFASVSPPAGVAASPAGLPVVPLERLEAEICELAGHLAAATCRFLVLLADFDARRGWASWEMSSCAQWLSWKCQLSSGTAREHVRVARALRDLPVIRARFAAAGLSYAKVRALTRVATAATEAGLAELAGPMTANQLERFARAHRQVTQADDADARVRRRLTWRRRLLSRIGCRWSGWRRRSASWPGTWPRRRAGSWCCWPSSMSAVAGRAGS